MVIDHFPSWMTGGGIFAALGDDVPWAETVDPITLDIQYFGNRSGSKVESALLAKLARNNWTIDGTNLQRLVDVILGMYLDKWSRQWEAINAEYNPINNYDMTETTTPGVTRTLKRSIDMTDEVTNESSLKTNTTGKLYGLGSTTGKVSTETDGESTGSAEDNISTRHTTGEANSNVETESRTGTDELKRSGNIGVTTSAELVAGEMSMRQQWVFFDGVFADVDHILALPYYGGV